MSTRDDAVLTDAEKAAFARLQAQVVAGDRSFAPPRTWKVGVTLRHAGRSLGHILHLTWLGPLAMIVGVAAVAAGLVWSLPVAVVGLVLIAGGAVPVVEAGRARVERALSDRST